MIKLILVYLFLLFIVYFIQKIIFSKILSKPLNSNTKDNANSSEIIDVEYEEVE